MSDERLERLERKIDVLTAAVASRFDRVDRRFDRLEKYLKSIEKTQGHINNDLSDQVSRQEKRLTTVEKKMGA